MENYILTKDDFKKISNVLECEVVERADCTRFLLINEEEGRKLTFEIYQDIEICDKRGNLITVYTGNTHVQLHFVNGYIASESLGEVLFVSAKETAVSGMVIAKEAACNIYANVDNKVISGDFTSMAPEVMISGIALSIAEPLVQKIMGK